MKHSVTGGLIIVTVGVAYTVYNLYEIQNGLRQGEIEFKQDSSEGGGDYRLYTRKSAPLRYHYHLIRFMFGTIGGVIVTLIGLLYLLWII
jgi:hypothetical protein